MSHRNPLFIVLSLSTLVSVPVLADVLSTREPELVRDIEPGARGSAPVVFQRSGDLAWFLAGDNRNLWRTDGTAAGTFEICPFPGEIWPAPGSPLTWFFAANFLEEETARLWRSDGTLAGTFPVSPEFFYGVSTTPGPDHAFVPETGLFFFVSNDASAHWNEELWVTDGTVGGTRRVVDLNPASSSRPGSLHSLGGRVYFLSGDELGHDRQLWTSDGTAAGTFRVKDLQPGDDRVRLVERVGDRLVLLVVRDGGIDVWRSDGTEAGTVREAEIPAPADARPFHGRVAGPRLFFALARQTAEPSELWVTDGTAAGTVRLLEGVEWAANAVGNGIFFPHSDPEHGREPWWSDGTPAGTRRIADLCPGPCSSSPSFRGIFGGQAFFSTTDGAAGQEPWLTDGTAAGTRRLGDLCPGSCGSNPNGPEVAEGVLFFGIDNSPDGQEVWASDGTAAGTRAVTSFIPDLALYYGFDAAALPGRVVFAADEGIHGPEVWTLPWDVEPAPPREDWLASSQVPGFRFRVRIGDAAGVQVPACLAGTLCVSGAQPGRPEVFLRVSGPQPNGHLWPAVVTLSTNQVEVWVEQTATKAVRYYKLEAPGAASSALPGVLDRMGFLPVPGPASGEARSAPPQTPSGPWTDLGGFRVKARLTAGRQVRNARPAPCAADTLCLAGTGAPPGPPDVLVRIAGPRPNGFLWPMVARFTTQAVEVWIQQRKTGVIRYYRLEALPADGSALNGVFDSKGFWPR